MTTLELNRYFEILSKDAFKDSDLKERLLNDPIGTIQIVLNKNIEVPEGMKVEIIDQSYENKFLIHLIEINQEDEELSIEELDHIAGGVLGDPPPIILGKE